jgi:hypothetical protein
VGAASRFPQFFLLSMVFAFEGGVVMRITRSRYESSKKKLAKMDSLLQITSCWERTMKELGDASAEKVVAIETTKDGTVKVEFESIKERGMSQLARETTET